MFLQNVSISYKTASYCSPGDCSVNYYPNIA